MIDQSHVEARLNSIENLPSLPIVIHQIQKALANPDNSMGQISKIIEKDSSLALKTLKLVNSAYYGLRNPITSIKEAIIILGLETVHNLVLGLSVIKMFKNSNRKMFDHGAFWEHSLGCALISKNIAKHTHQDGSEECFIAGLLHDIGKLIFEQYLHEEYITVLKLTKDNDTALVSQETAVFGFTHADVGAFIAMKWKFPIQLAVIIRYHHSRLQTPLEFKKYKSALTIVSMANQICNEYSIGNSMENHWESDPAFSALNINKEELEEITTQVKDEIKSTLKEWNS